MFRLPATDPQRNTARAGVEHAGPLARTGAPPYTARIHLPTTRAARLLAGGLVAGIHLGLQFGLYAVGFAVGPEWATREFLGVSLYGIAAVVTFPFVHLAEQSGWPGLGMVALPLNSLAWGGAVWLLLGLADRLRAGRKPRP